jgi:hypothetical protein
LIVFGMSLGGGSLIRADCNTLLMASSTRLLPHESDTL